MNNKPGSISENKGVISSITDLMLDKFIIAMCDDDLSVLVTDWTYVTEDDVTKAWENICDEHRDLLKSRERSHLEQISKELNMMITKREVIRACLYRLSIAYSEDIVKELKKWTMVIEKFNQDDPESYIKDLHAIKNRNTRIDIDIRELEKELKRHLPDGIEKQNSREAFFKNIIALEKHIARAIDETKTSVYKYDLMLVDLIMKAEATERQIHEHAKQ